MLIVTIHHGILGDGYTKAAQVCAGDIDPASIQSVREYVCELHDMCDDEIDEILVIKNGRVTPFITDHFYRNEKQLILPCCKDCQ